MAITDTLESINGAQIVSIELPEDRQCSHSTRSGGFLCTVRTGGDILEGNVGIRLNSSHCHNIDVCFEGICRTWTSDTGSGLGRVNEHCFLLQVQSLKVELEADDEHSSWPMVRKVLFHFRIPVQIPATLASNTFDPDQAPRELYLSIRMGLVYQEPVSNKVFAQPFIVYKLCASIRTKKSLDQPRRDFTRPVAVMPTTLCPPPIHTSAFRGEYRLHAKSKICNHFCGRSIGSLQFVIEGPQAIHISKSFPRSETVVSLRLSFQPAQTVSEFKITPYNWRFKIRFRLQHRVFWTTKPLARVPTLADVGSLLQTRMRAEVLHTDKHEYAGVLWRNNYFSTHGAIVSVGEKTAPWIAMIPVVISADNSLIPSFYSPLVSLRYSILLEIQVLGSWFSHASLTIPLQVICPSRQSLGNLMDLRNTLASDMIEGGIEEDVGSESIEQPPEYRRIPF